MGGDILEFVIKIREMVSGGVQKMAANTHSSFARVNYDIKQTQSHLNHLSSPVKIKVDTSEIAGANNMLRSIVGGNLIATGITRGISMGISTVASSLDAAMQFGMAAKSFEVMTGSATRGRELVAELRYLKENTIMGASVYKNAQTLMGFGVNDNSVVGVLRQIGDVSMGNVEKMQALTLAYAQTSASGKLMGQDLLQYVNAGFNPLSVMADRWKDFGYKQKVSVGQLKELMGKGEISSLQIAKAFELATSKGGKFYKMMDLIGETTGGKMAKMKGEWAAMQIDIGNALMPMASSFMDAGHDVLHWLNISKSVPETLIGEQMEIATLVTSITQLNEGNQMRGRMLDILNAKYPDLFGNIDKEKIKNEELLAIVGKVNKAYDKRIEYASYKMIGDEQKKQANDLHSLAVKAKIHATAMRTGQESSSPLGWWDMMRIRSSNNYGRGVPVNLHGREADIYNYEAFAAETMKEVDRLQKMAAGNERQVTALDLNNLIVDANALNPKKMKELWGSHYTSNAAAYNKEMNVYRQMYKDSGGFMSAKMLARDWSGLEKLVHYKQPGVSGMGGEDGMGGIGKKITGGGQKVIHINFKNVVENMKVEGANAVEQAADWEYKVKIIMDRIFAGLPA